MLQQCSSPGCAASSSRPSRKLEAVICRLQNQVLKQRCSSTSGARRSEVQRVQVACAAVEQDLEVASTSGRNHSNGVPIRAFFSTPDPDLVGEPLVEAAPEYKIINNRLKSCSTLPLLLDAIREDGPRFNHINTSFALYRLTQLHNALFMQLHAAQLASKQAQQAAYSEYVAPALTALNQLARDHAPQSDAWGVSLSLWALGNMSQAEDLTLSVLCQRGVEQMQEFKPIDCACALVGLAKLQSRPRVVREFVDHLLHHILEILNHQVDWRPQELANVAWSLSKLGAGRSQHKRVLLETLMEMVLWKLEDFTMQELTTIVYSYGCLHYRIPRGLQTISLRVARHIQLLNSQDAANMMYGFACLDFKPHPVLLDRLPLVLVDRLSEFKPQEVCNLLYGYSHMRHHHPLLLEAVARACAPRLHEFSTQDLVLTIWSYGMVEHIPTEPALFQNACCVLLAREEELLPGQMAIVLKGFSRAGYQPPPAFMGAIAQAAIRKLQQFKPVEFCQLLWSFAQLGYRDVQLFEAVVGHALYLLQAWERPLPKTTIDTLVWCCQRVGFWPQALVDAAEMRGIYVRNAHPTGEEQEIGQLGLGPSLPGPSTGTAQHPEQQQQQWRPRLFGDQEQHGGGEQLQQQQHNRAVDVGSGGGSDHHQPQQQQQQRRRQGPLGPSDLRLEVLTDEEGSGPLPVSTKDFPPAAGPDPSRMF